MRLLTDYCVYDCVQPTRFRSSKLTNLRVMQECRLCLFVIMDSCNTKRSRQIASIHDNKVVVDYDIMVTLHTWHWDNTCTTYNVLICDPRDTILLEEKSITLVFPLLQLCTSYVLVTAAAVPCQVTNVLVSMGLRSASYAEMSPELLSSFHCGLLLPPTSWIISISWVIEKVPFLFLSSQPFARSFGLFI